jgi:hypothetical protein
VKEVGTLLKVKDFDIESKKCFLVSKQIIQQAKTDKNSGVPRKAQQKVTYTIQTQRAKEKQNLCLND